ncbi:DUF222 domain-containing protein [Arthrobacter sp. NPDC058097]|uniref:HNH endonuclease signature motif containing protein n=1 Tax=Arthrobacter sp. NPDC058097 TaxID=3346340 RepID=UPI0036DE3C58
MEAIGEDRAEIGAGTDVSGPSAAALLRGRRLRSVPSVTTDLKTALALLDSATSSAPEELATANFLQAADFAELTEKLSRRVEYFQVLAAGAVDRTRTEAINAAATASRAAGWTTGWGTEPEPAPAPDAQPSDTAAPPASAPASAVGWSPADDGARNTAEFLRTRLRISTPEARRRLALANATLPRTGLAGRPLPPEHEETAAALTAGTISSRAGTTITTALDKVRHTPDPALIAEMEHNLTQTAIENDHDFLTRIAHRWIDALDQDGTEPSEENLRHRQGVFIHHKRGGLHHLEIRATTDQYEVLTTVMNTATNPRTTTPNTTTCGTDSNPGGDNDGSDSAAVDPDTAFNTPTPLPDLDRRTPAQQRLDGLVGASKAALAAGTLPTTGGLRPQVMVTVSYRDLLNSIQTTATRGPRYAPKRNRTGTRVAGINPPGINWSGTDLFATPGAPAGAATGSGTFAYTGPVTASTIRKIACDADIIPVLLGSEGRILDIGRTTRVFPPHIRKALNARDQGCAFPNCTIPAPWCEAHHITYWSRGGPTNTDNGVLLCTHHHHLIHKEQWKIHIKNGIPWFIPPPHIDPRQQPRQNHHHKT